MSLERAEEARSHRIAEHRIAEGRIQVFARGSKEDVPGGQGVDIHRRAEISVWHSRTAREEQEEISDKSTEEA